MSKLLNANKLDLICEELKLSIKSAYEQGVSIPEAEKLAARTLTVRLELADEIKIFALDSRMKKHGVKAVRAKVYMDEISKNEKKPPEAYLENAVNLSEEVAGEEENYGLSETELHRLEAYLDVFKDAHIYFRTIAKGSFEG